MRSIKGLLPVMAVLMAMGAFLPASSQAAPNYDQTCGTLPGDGAFGYVRVANTTCRHGWKVTRKAIKKFCEVNNDCEIDWESNIEQVYRGTIRRNGWTCKVANGWEYYRAKCRKGDMRALARGGA